MKYVLGSYRDGGGARRTALVVDDVLYALSEALGADGPTWARGSFEGVIVHGDEASSMLESLPAPASSPISAKLDAPLRPTRIFAAASNYVELADEMGTVIAAKKDGNPCMFTKIEHDGDRSRRHGPHSTGVEKNRLERSSSASSSANAAVASRSKMRSITWRATPWSTTSRRAI